MDAFSVRTKIMLGGGMDALAQRLHRVFLVTDKFMAESGKRIMSPTGCCATADGYRSSIRPSGSMR